MRGQMSIEQLRNILTTEGITRTARLAKTVSKQDEVKKLISELLDVLTISIISDAFDWNATEEGDTISSSEVHNLFEITLVKRTEKNKDEEVTITLYEELRPTIVKIAGIDIKNKESSSIALSILGFDPL